MFCLYVWEWVRFFRLPVCFSVSFWLGALGYRKWSKLLWVLRVKWEKGGACRVTVELVKTVPLHITPIFWNVPQKTLKLKAQVGLDSRDETFGFNRALLLCAGILSLSLSGFYCFLCVSHTYTLIPVYLCNTQTRTPHTEAVCASLVRRGRKPMTVQQVPLTSLTLYPLPACVYVYTIYTAVTVLLPQCWHSSLIWVTGCDFNELTCWSHLIKQGL